MTTEVPGSLPLPLIILRLAAARLRLPSQA